MKFVNTKEAPQAIGAYSQAISVNGFIYTSGQIALNAKGEMEKDDIERQTHQVMKNLFYILEEAKAHFNDVVKTTIYLSDMDNFDKVNAIYSHYFGMHKPARSTIAVKTLPKNALVEIECIAISNADYNY